MDLSQLPYSSLSLAYVESLYADFLADPRSVPEDWRRFFETAQQAPEAARFLAHPKIGPSVRPAGLFGGGPGNGAGVGMGGMVERGERGGDGISGGGRQVIEVAALQDRVDQLIRAYRVRGHMVAALDPLGRALPDHPELNPTFYHLSEADLDRPFSSNTIEANSVATLRQIIHRMRNTYCRSIGVQFMHIDDIQVKHWLQRRMERNENRMQLTPAEQAHIYTRLTDAVTFEEFIRKKFVAAKSFSLEGAESLIPLIDLAISAAGGEGLDEIVIGMAHRGRLNVLANVLGKSPRAIFAEFEDRDAGEKIGCGDVKYHLGFSTDHITPQGQKIHLSLCFNPSHLEYVNAVAVGRLRAKQDRVGDVDHTRGMTMLIHGDSAFAGEGVVQETLNLSQLEGYRTGGTLHIVVNNQIGFTTAPNESRSSIYSTDVAKMLESPIFHVNGEDPEAVATVVKLAMEFRRIFQRDVVIDMYCYRRRGHNESDEPAFTQPILYRAIEQRPGVREAYLQHLLQLRGLTREQADAIDEKRRRQLEEELSIARSALSTAASPEIRAGVWQGYQGGREADVPEAVTAVDEKRLANLGELLTRLPTDFHVHPKVERLLEHRLLMAQGKAPLDWAMGEALAFAALATEGKPIRMSGQDSLRGTFSQRHAMLHDIEDGHTYMPLQNLSPSQAAVNIFNSPLSEAGVLGFEYGYSLDCPQGLVAWEAQFGDFINCAQVIVDQFIASAEDKWRRLSGLVLLLPHGMEGMGPEHSSARLERLLLLATEENIQVVNPTTPAQYFHLLRRQVLRAWRKPLFVLTPKSLLRAPAATSGLAELATGTFQRVVGDLQPAAAPIRRLLLCSGKVYYDLAQRRAETKRSEVAIARLEQLYPFPEREVTALLASIPTGVAVTWVQEEPENMGAWRYLRALFGETLHGRVLRRVSRPASASPATGSAGAHKLEQKRLLDEAFEK
ncbi:MAG: 2-oxoglutarate dehydrogenase E1 component [Planctomycetota bacterium]